MGLCPNRNSIDFMDSFSVFQEPVLIKTQVQSVSCHRNKDRARTPWQDKRFNHKAFSSLSKQISRVSLEVTANQAVSLLFLAAVPQPSLLHDLLTEEVISRNQCLDTLPLHLPKLTSILR